MHSFQRVFVDRSDAFRIDYRQFQRSLQTLKQIFSRWGRDKAGEKQRYMSTFSATNWTKLSMAKKEQHTFSKCKGCFHSFTEIQGMFPVKSPKFKNAANENPFYIAKNLPKILGDSTKIIYNSVNKPFERTFGVSFAEAQTKVPELHLQFKKIKYERKAELRQTYTKVKKTIQERWNETSVERCYGTRQSLKACNTERLSLGFESVRSAKERTDKMHSSISCGKSKPKKHAGDFSLAAWDKERMKTEFNNYPEGTVVNWSSIARKYNITDGKGKISPNGGQIAKEWLSTQGFDVE